MFPLKDKANINMLDYHRHPDFVFLTQCKKCFEKIAKLFEELQYCILFYSYSIHNKCFFVPRGIEEDKSVWKSNYLELEKDINRFCHDISTSSKSNQKKTSTPRSSSNSVSALQSLLVDTKSQVLARLRQIEEKDRSV